MGLPEMTKKHDEQDSPLMNGKKKLVFFFFSVKAGFFSRLYEIHEVMAVLKALLQLVLKLHVNDEQVLNIAVGRITRISGNYKINMNKTTKLLTVTGDDIDPIEIVRKLRMLCPVEIVAVETPKEPEKKKEELVEEVVNVSSLAAAAGPSKEPKKKEEEQKKQEEKKKGEELITDVKEDPNKTFRARQMKKAVLKLDLHDEKARTKALKTVSGHPGVESMSIELKNKTMTVIGDIDAIQIVDILRKLCVTEIISLGPAKEPEKKEHVKKKEEPGEHYEDPVAELVKAYNSYNPHMPPYSYVRRAEEDPNTCVIT